MALVALGETQDINAVERLLTELDNNDNKFDQAIITSLGKIGDARAVTPIIAFLKRASSPTMNLAIVESLIKIGEGSVEPLISLLNEKKERKESAILILGKIGDARAVMPLITVLATGDISERRLAAEALELLGWEPKDDRKRALQSIALDDFDKAITFGEAAVEPLVYALGFGSIAYKAEPALIKMGRTGNEYVVPNLIKLLLRKKEPLKRLFAENNRDTEVHYGRPASRGSSGNKRKIEVDGDFRLAETAVKMLAQIGDARAVKPLIEAYTTFPYEEFPGYISAAVDSLEKLLENLLKIGGTDIPTDDLQAIAVFKDQHRSWYSPGSCTQYPSTQHDGVSCSRIRQLVRQELIRRGIEA